MDVTTDRAEIIELFARYADIADTRDFEALPPLVHADPFTADFSSVTGQAAQQVALADYVASLRTAFARFAATHHAITGHLVTIDGDQARARAHVRADHWVSSDLASAGPDCWTVIGHYDNEVVRTPDGWRFSLVRLTVRHQVNANLAHA